MRIDDESLHAAAVAANGSANENQDRLTRNQPMLDTNAIATASRTLHDHWRAGSKISGLDDTLRPRDRIEAYAIQAALENFSSANLFGWKIAATSEAGQKHINV